MTGCLIQATFAEFLERGDLDRHVRRTRRIYRQRRDALVAALSQALPGCGNLRPSQIHDGIRRLAAAVDR